MTQDSDLQRIAAQARADIEAAKAAGARPADDERALEDDSELQEAYASWRQAQRFGSRRDRATVVAEIDLFERKLERKETFLRHAPDHFHSRAEANIAALEQHLERLYEEIGGHSRVYVNGDPLPLRPPRCGKCGNDIDSIDPCDNEALVARVGLCDACLAGFGAVTPRSR